MTLEFQITTHAWRTRFKFRLTWDGDQFALACAAPLCSLILRLHPEPADALSSLP